MSKKDASRICKNAIGTGEHAVYVEPGCRSGNVFMIKGTLLVSAKDCEECRAVRKDADRNG